LPDIDSKFSELGKNKSFRIIQLFLKHRGILHSFIFLILMSILLALFLPVFALPVFLGYGLHLFADSFTVSGLKLFYPFKKIYCGPIKTGTKKETLVFVVFLLADIVFLASIIFN
ncbi:MAG: metal-dependent hydrolase, partial [archaeon]